MSIEMEWADKSQRILLITYTSPIIDGSHLEDGFLRGLEMIADIDHAFTLVIDQRQLTQVTGGFLENFSRFGTLDHSQVTRVIVVTSHRRMRALLSLFMRIFRTQVTMVESLEAAFQLSQDGAPV